MPEEDTAKTALRALKSGERTLVLSFLSMSERKTQDATAMEELAEAIAIKAALRETPN